MSYIHIAHDCTVGNNNTFANNATLAGHAQVGNHSVMSAYAKIAQCVQVGSNCMVGAATNVFNDIPSYWLVAHSRARALGINLVGLKRFGMTKEQIANLRRAFRLAYAPVSLQERCDTITTQCTPGSEIDELLQSLQGMRKGLVPLVRTSHQSQS